MNDVVVLINFSVDDFFFLIILFYYTISPQL